MYVQLNGEAVKVDDEELVLAVPLPHRDELPKHLQEVHDCQVQVEENMDLALLHNNGMSDNLKGLLSLSHRGLR